MKKPSVGIAISGWAFVLLGIGGLVRNALEYIKLTRAHPLELFLAPLKISAYDGIYSFLLIALPFLYLIVWCLCAVISGLGVLRLKQWARRMIMPLLPASALCTLVAIRWQRTTPLQPLVLLLAGILVIRFFMRDKTKSQFEGETKPFRLFSVRGLAPSLILLFAMHTFLTVLGLKVYLRVRDDTPFFMPAPEPVQLQDKSHEEQVPAGYRNVQLLNASFLIPKDLIIGLFYQPGSPGDYWRCYLKDLSDKKRIIRLDHHSSCYLLTNSVGRLLGLKNSYEFEKETYTTNWNPLLVWLQSYWLGPGKLIEINELQSSNLRGFVRFLRKEESNQRISICSFYNRDKSLSMEMEFICKDEDFDKDELFEIASSFKFMEEDASRADIYFQAGLRLRESGDAIGAQFKLANAYYLSSGDPVYGYELAAALAESGDCSFYVAEQILTYVLEQKPDYNKAKQLLDTVKAK